MIEMLGSEQLKEQLYILQYIFPRKKCLFSDLLAILWTYHIESILYIQVSPNTVVIYTYLQVIVNFTTYCIFTLIYTVIYTYLCTVMLEIHINEKYLHILIVFTSLNTVPTTEIPSMDP